MHARNRAAIDFAVDVVHAVLSSAAITAMFLFLLIVLGLLPFVVILVVFERMGTSLLDLLLERLSFSEGDLFWVLPTLLGITYLAVYGETFHRLCVKREQKGYGVPKWGYPQNWSDIRQAVLARDSYACGNCGSAQSLHVHHIVPLSVGGSNNLGNLRTLCRECHTRLHPHMRDTVDERNAYRPSSKIPPRVSPSTNRMQREDNVASTSTAITAGTHFEAWMRGPGGLQYPTLQSYMAEHSWEASGFSAWRKHMRDHRASASLVDELNNAYMQ